MSAARDMANTVLRSFAAGQTSAYADEFPVEAFRYRIDTFGGGLCSVPASLLCRALAAWSNEKTKREIAENALEVMRRENQMLWTSIANRDEATA